MTHTGRGKQKASFFVAQLDLYMCASSQHFSIDKVGPKVQQNTLEINRSAIIDVKYKAGIKKRQNQY